MTDTLKENKTFFSRGRMLQFCDSLLFFQFQAWKNKRIRVLSDTKKKLFFSYSNSINKIEVENLKYNIKDLSFKNIKKLKKTKEILYV